MCLLAFRWQPQADYRLVLFGHRDEYYARPTASLQAWTDGSGIIGGRDLQAGGTWLGVCNGPSGLRMAVLTNIREPGTISGRRSRGELVSGFLSSALSPAQFSAELDATASAGAEYNGFNLLAFADNELWLLSNRTPAHKLAAGLYGLSNGRLNAPWPKTEFAKQQLHHLLTTPAAHTNGLDAGCLNTGLLSAEPAPTVAWLDYLRDKNAAADHLLPDTGVGLIKERWLAPAFIHSPAALNGQYGTRSGHLFSLHRNGDWQLCEREYDPVSAAISASRRCHGQVSDKH